MRKLLLFALAIIMSPVAMAQNDSRLKFMPIGDNHASVSAQNQDIEGDIVIPSTVSINGKNYTVTAIADEGFKNSKISSVNLPPTIEVIGNSAFFRCLNLAGIVIPPSVMDIGVDAFYYCSSMEYIQVTNGNQMFRNVGKLVVGKDGYIYAYPGKGDAVFNIPDGIKGIERKAISGCQYIKEVYIPSSVKYVDRMAFLFCEKLERLHWNASPKGSL